MWSSVKFRSLVEERLHLISREEALQPSSSLNIDPTKSSLILKKACQNPQWSWRMMSKLLSIGPPLNYLREVRIYPSLKESWRMTLWPTSAMLSKRVKIFLAGNSSLQYYLIPHSTVYEHVFFLSPLLIWIMTIHHFFQCFTISFQLYFSQVNTPSCFHLFIGVLESREIVKMSVGWNSLLPKKVLQPHRRKHQSLFKALKTVCTFCE